MIGMSICKLAYSVLVSAWRSNAAAYQEELRTLLLNKNVSNNISFTQFVRGDRMKLGPETGITA